MPTKASLTDDMKTAMKARDTQKLGVIRFLLSELKNEEIDNGELDEVGIETVIARQIKQTKESIEELQKSGRDELVAEETAKLAVLQSYLPAPLSEDELQAVVSQVVATTDNPNMGQVITAVKAKVGTRAEGSVIATMVKEALSQ
ncbi:MAG: GatB/YqeY domain-containing protein [Pseudomonadales bacterium]|nr:GatB/YqeY domain-containing protein [Candidatus Woesebacteria bacterium]MCB9801689.1 GatB/YqeY domain-containing protein [Pseudomonadales bacterium]